MFFGFQIRQLRSPGCGGVRAGLQEPLPARRRIVGRSRLVKPERALLLAYDDPLGVTEAFNRNLLVRINRELGGSFDLDAFAHEAVWNAGESRIEMHLRSTAAQRVRVEAAGIAFRMRAGERIWTESSYKFQPEDVAALLERAAFRVTQQWIDNPDLFALTLAEAV